MTVRDRTCRGLADVLMAYEDGELGRAERLGFEAHLAECPDCLRYLAGYRATGRPESAASELVDFLSDFKAMLWRGRGVSVRYGPASHDGVSPGLRRSVRSGRAV